MAQSYTPAIYTNESVLGRYTPRQLINHHIEFPEEPITKAHIENLILGNTATPAGKQDRSTLPEGKPR